MSYTDDTATVMTAMGYDYTEGPDGPEAWLGLDGWRVDANFVVERVIPGMVAQDFAITVSIGSLDSWEPEQFDVMVRHEDGSEFSERAPEFKEAVMAAIAAALRSQAND